MENLQKVLITQSQLKNYSGSEIVTLELAEHLSRLNIDVTILTHYVGSPISEDFDALHNVTLVLANSEAAERIKVNDYDLIWIHHFTLTPSLLDQITEASTPPYIVFHHMSKSEPLEFPIMYHAEKGLADVVAFNSQETCDEIGGRGARFEKGEISVLDNPAPDGFYESMLTHGKKNITRHAHPTKIAVVSNHVPVEINKAAELLHDKGVEVDFIGRAGGEEKRVTPEVLREYDVVVSIGKTVQYCIVSGLPVYCYDRFGGPGFLDRDNFKLSRYYNFSGRGFAAKKPDEIAAEILEQFAQSLEEIAYINSHYAHEFLLSRKFKEIFKKLQRKKTATKSIAVVEKNSLSSYLAVVNKFLSGHLRYYERSKRAENALSDCRSRRKEQQEELKELQKRLRDTNSELAALEAKTAVKIERRIESIFKSKKRD